MEDVYRGQRLDMMDMCGSVRGIDDVVSVVWIM